MLEVWQRAPFLRMLVPLISGVLIFDSLDASGLFLFSWIVFSFFSLGVLVSAFFSYRFARRHFYGVFSAVFFCVSGFLIACSQRPENTSGYFGEVFNEPCFFVCSFTGHGNEVVIRQIQFEDSCQNANLIARVQWPFSDTLHQTILPGSSLVIQGSLEQPQPPANPDVFNYALYLKRRNVAGILKTKSYTVLDEAVEGSFSIQCLRLRRVLLQRMRSYVEDELVYGVLAALVLGDTSSMQDEIQTAYANAGAVHILAVSGLHVGLIYALLAPLMKRLFSKRRARWFKTLLPMLLLWIYAGVTGLSPSVLRAAVMFSFFLIADNYAKKGNAVNTLAASALLLLVCNSALCFDVGFQLSYAAVAGIVVLQKPIERLWILPRGWQYNLWKVVAVSIAAQLATLPFTLYYFQQFPTYFLITNLLAIPISTVVLYTMLAFLLFSWYPPLAWLLANLGTSLTELMNGVVDCCAQLPGGVLRGGFIRHGEPLFFAVALFATIRWWLWVKPRALLVASISFFCISTNRLSNEYASPNKLWLFHASTKGDVVTFQNGNEVICYVDSSFMANEQERRNTVARFHFMQGFGDVRPVLMEPNDKQIPFQIPELDLVRLTPELLIDADTLPWRVIWIGSDMKSFLWKPKQLLLLENKELILSGTVSPKTVRFLGQKLSGCSELIDLRKRVFSTSK